MRARASGQSAYLLLDVIERLDQLHISYAVIGAMAASFYGVVRASLDADAVISLASVKAGIPVLRKALDQKGLKVSFHSGDRDDPIGAVMNIEDKFGNRVDLLMNIKGVSEDIFSRTISSKLENTKILFAGPEDFIAMKIFAGSPQDISDARGVFQVSAGKIDKTLLKKLVSVYGPSALKTLESLLKNF